MSEPSGTRPFAPFEWMLSLRYLRARRKEGFISVIAAFSFLGIMLGVATLIIVMAVMNGFRKELLRDQRLVLGRLDGRYTSLDVDAAGERQEFDPSNQALQGPYTATFQDYLRNELKWETELRYPTSGNVRRIRASSDAPPTSPSPENPAIRLRNRPLDAPFQRSSWFWIREAAHSLIRGRSLAERTPPPSILSFKVFGRPF